jgi:LPS-assembly protein
VVGVVRGGDGTLLPGRLTLAVVAAVLATSATPTLADVLSARDLAGTGEGFRDFDLGRDSAPAASPTSGGILGGLAPPSGNAPDIRLNPVPEAPGAIGTLPNTPRLQAVTPVAVPTPRLRPVPDTLPALNARPAMPQAVPAGSLSSAPASAPATAPSTTPPPDPSAVNQPNPTLIRADELRYDRDISLYRARGNVELTTDGRVVMADTVAYNEQTDTLTANGNVRVVETDGTVYFANYIELSADFKDGFVRDMSVLLTDRSRIVAVHATRTAGERKDFWKGIYTACDTCPTEEGSPWPTLSGNQAGTRERQRPIWQLRAAHVTHDEVARDLIYRDATLELFGIPVLYTPYLTQPDPTVYRRSGVLMPTWGMNSSEEETQGENATMGFWVEVPYYMVIDDQQDATIRVRGMSEEAWLLDPEYRLRFAEGELAVRGSLTDDSVEGLSGHLESRGRWHINDVWRAGFDSEIASHDGYLDKYGYSEPNWLTNHGWVEAFSDRSYASVEAFAYDRTSVGVSDRTNPVVLPLATYDYISEPVFFGGHAVLNGDVQHIDRETGARSARMSGSLGWTRPGTLDWGLAYDLDARVNADVYLIEGANTVAGVPGSGFDGTISRVYPSARARARYPMVRIANSHRQVLEPFVTVALSPPNLNSRHIPNEDSQDPQLTHANLLTGDRTAGRDRVDDGVSVNYGVQWTYIDPEAGKISASVGQAWRPYGSDFFPASAGYGEGLSDIVGNINVQPNRYLDLYYSYRLNTEDLTPNRSVLGFSLGSPVLRLTGTYLAVGNAEAGTGRGLDDREELTMTARTAFSRYWNAYVGARYNIATDRMVSTHSGVSYNDECLTVGLAYTESYNGVGSEDDETSLVLQVLLKTLGEIRY